MTLWVHAYCGYPSYSGGGSWQADDYDALTMVRAVKGQDLKKGYAKIKSRAGATVTVDAGHRANAAWLFGEWAAHRLTEIGLESGLLVPIPSSSCLALNGDPKGRALAEAIALRAPKFSALSAIHWHEEFQKAADGGPRQEAVLLPNMRFVTTLPPSTIVLVDDVVTTGGHLKAAAEGLRSFGHTVEHAICVAHTVHEHPAAGMFAIEPFDAEANPFSAFF